MKAIPELQTLSSHPKRLGWLVHSIVWIVLCCFPFFLFTGRDSTTISLHDYQRSFITMMGAMVVFYMNYSYLIERFLFARRVWLYLFSNMLLVPVVIIASHLLFRMTPPPEVVSMPNREYRIPFYFFIFIDVIKYIFITVLSVALKATNSWYKIDTERKDLEKQRSEAELQNLKNQLNPHFLFNTLNNIYSLIAINGEQAQEAVHELGRLLRYILYDSAHEYVTLGKDIDFVRDYVALMRIRMPEHVELKTEIQIGQPDVLIAPLLFISLIENAFKHGVSNSKPSFIHITITADNKQIKCTIRNSYFPKDEHDQSGSGIGLVNLQKRLDLLYPNNYTFSNKHQNEVYSSILTITIEH